MESDDSEPNQTDYISDSAVFPKSFLTIVTNESARDEKYFICNICNFTTLWASHLKVHLRTHSGEKPFRCTQCSYASARRTDVKRHETIHALDKPFRCSHCSYSGRRKSDLVRHQKLHLDIKPFHCAKCNYSTTRKEVLKTHETIHFKEKVSVSNEWEVANNFIIEHEDGGNEEIVLIAPSAAPVSCKQVPKLVRLRCEQCGFSTQCKSDFIRHMKTHDIIYECPHCEYSTNRRVQFNVHIRIHLGLKHYQCDKCSYVAMYKSEILRHMDSHPLNEQTFEECTKILRKYNKVIRPCFVKVERLPIPNLHLTSDDRIEIVNADQLPSSVLENQEFTDDQTSTCFIIIRPKPCEDSASKISES